MADLLADGVRATPDLRRQLQDEASAESDDLLARLNVLDYLDSIVGDVGSDLPERLGDYRIIGLLGRGGMGTVFEAFQESLERIVALKVLAPSLTTDPRMRKRFRVEARASATLHHQFIVPVYGFGEAGGHLYFAMERVDGVSLDKHISAARHRGAPVMEAREAARRFAGVADALGHAHRRGILHRDIKPGNILVHPDGSLALADFGLSKMMGEPSLSISQHGGFLGTLHYAAPEQARGRPVTPASDLYSLGVTIYECVTGQLPVQGETTEALLQALLNEDARPLRQLVPRAPRDLEIVLEKLLSKDPDDRYSDGEALARDLLRVADDEPVLVRRRPILVRAWRQVRKHSLLSAALALSILLLLTVFVLWRQVVGEEETARIALHAARLNEAVAMAETEPGRFDGPDGLLAVLLGVELAAGGTDTRVVAMLDEAEAARPEQPRTRELRAAYLADPVPAATEALRSGRGQVALGLLDREIEASESSGFAERDAVTWLRLYRLYLARAVARLTAAVADADGAGDDLLRAAFVRPGAFVPALLAALVDWDPARGTGPLFDQVDALLRDRPAAAGRVAAELLRAVALDDRPIGAHLLPLSIPYALRRELLRRAVGYAGGALAARSRPNWPRRRSAPPPPSPTRRGCGRPWRGGGSC
jgi:predicted Ser/Thr protein kinase